MSKKYHSPITKLLNRDNWQDNIPIQNLTLPELAALRYDMTEIEKLGKQVAGFLREIIINRMGKDDHFDSAFTIDVADGFRAGGLDRVRLLEEYGEQWINKYSSEPSEYKVLRIKPNADWEG